MKDQADTATLELIPQPRRRGRPATGNAKSGAERQAAYRARQHHESVTVTINRDDVVTLSTALHLAAKMPSFCGDADPESIQRLIAALDDACGGKVLKGA